MSEQDKNFAGPSIAVVGMAGRFPGARNLNEFWRNLRDGVESISVLDDEHLLAAGATPAEIQNPDYVKAASILDDIDRFDASFFGLSPRDAAIMDPQHRLFLECAWEALENAGWSADEFAGRVGVYAGSGMNTYLIHNLLANPELVADAGLFLLKQTGNDKDVLATRVSYQLNLTGPSLAVQTACSTSLVAIHLACQSLLNHECDMALAGGVTIEMPHGLGYLYREGEILSRDGHCRSFDAASSGTIFGSGLGIVVLRRLEDAVKDGDFIHAAIRGTAINNDGARKVGYLAPSVAGQADVIAEALAVADAEADSISYIETHGTGTVVGDPIEVAALTRAFRTSTERSGFCAIGSLKTNVGHLDAAAGVAGFIKTVLALEHRQLPPSLNFSEPNPLIDFERSPFYVNSKLREWESDGKPRRAGVTSLGIGGTNAHAILEEAPPAPASSASRPWQVLTLSAKSPPALDAMARNLAEYLEESSPNVADVAFTGHLGRKAFRFRRTVICRDAKGAAETLRRGDSKRIVSNTTADNDRPVIFLCPGQGSQYVSMARGLYESEPAFKSTIDFCAEYLQRFIGLDLRTILFPSETEAGAAAELLNQTRLTQPALFVIEYALARLWMSWGIEPAAMIGHSVGELAAACIAGVFTLEAGLEIIAERGRLIQSMPTGSMTAVPIPESEVLPLLNGKLSLASVNCDDQCVVSGPDYAIGDLEKSLAAKGMAYHRLRVSHAFHSSMMDPILREFADFVRKFELAPPRIRYISSATGNWITDAEATDPNYWAGQLRQTVRFADGIGNALKTSDAILLEVGPGNTLSALCEQSPQFSDSQQVISSLRTRTDDTSDDEFLARALGQLWAAGKKIDWKTYHAHENRRRLPIPTYAFQRERFWIEPGRKIETTATPSTESASEVREIGFFSPSWKRADLTEQERGKSVGPWLIFEDSQGLGARIAQLLKRRGEECISVVPGKSFVALASAKFEIDPDDPGDYQRLLSAISARGKFPRTFVHLWSVCDPDAREDLPGDVDAAETMSFYSLLVLAQALGALDLEGSIEIAVVSNRLHQVADEPVLRPTRALLAGPCGVIPKELTNVRCRNIDLDDLGTDAADKVLAELQSQSIESPVAYRKDGRWVQTFVKSRETENQKSVALRERGVYLITGGLGGIGLTLAESIAKSVQARLVLLGRSAFPARESWDEWLSAHADRDPIARQIKKIRAIEDAGAEVMVATADVCDSKAMQRVAHQVHEQFGPINGVIHAAGVLEDAPMLQKDRASAAGVLAPKVRGTLVLESVLQRDPIDFFFLMSSVSSHLAPTGQVDYTAANAFLDAFARSRSKGSTRVVSIQWPRWTDVGLAAIESSVDAVHPLLGHAKHEGDGTTTYSTTLSLENDWIVAEHRLNGSTGLFPATGYLEMARAAVLDLTGSSAASISDFYVSQPLKVEPNSAQPVRFLARKQDEGYRFSAQTYSEVSRRWIECASGTVAAGIPSQLPRYDIDSLRGRCSSGTLGFERPARNEAQERYIAFGSRWRNLKTVWLGRDEALSQLELSEEFAAEVDTYRLHPALLDMATGSAMLLIKGNEAKGYLYVPISYGNVTISGPLQASCYAYVRSKTGASIESPIATFDVSIMDGNGKTIVEVRDFSVRQIRDPALLEGSNTALAKELENPQDLEVAEAAVRLKLPDAISSEEGREAFERIIGSPRSSSVVVFPSNFEAYMDRTKPRHLLVPSERSIADSNDSSDEEVEETLTRWWRELLGVGAVSLQDNFFDLGGQSLTGVRLLSKIKKKYGVDLKLNTLFAAPTIEKLCALIPNQTAQPSVLSRMRTSSTPGPRGDSHSGSLIEIRRGGPRNLFLVHDGGGDMPYLNLARRMPEDVGVFGIEPRRVAGVPLAHVSIEDMASFYVEEIRGKQPHGPYLLGGICAGGVIAYEMASQLIRAGESVELVAMLDAALAGIEERPGLHTKQQLDRFKTALADSKKSEVGPLNRARVLMGAIQELVNFLLSEVARRGARLSVRARFRLLRVLLSRDLAWPRFVPELSVLEIYESAAARYIPSPLSISSIVLARAKTGEGLDKPYKEIYADETLGWSGIARGLVIVDVDGGHFTMLQERFVASLWEALMPYLQREAKQSANVVRPRAEHPVALPAMTSESIL
jgi:acyl transferase domain-containing protein/thioesterase domain-containing protein